MIKIKKFNVLIFIFVIGLALSACVKRENAESGLSVKEMAAVVIDGQDGLPALYAIGAGEESFEAFAELYVRNHVNSLSDGVICYPAETAASEIAIFMFRDDETAEKARESLTEYKNGRADAFAGYAPEQSALAENGRVTVNGKYAALFICSDPEKAEASFLSCFGDNPPKVNLSDILTSPVESERIDATTVDCSTGSEPLVSGTEPESTGSEQPDPDPEPIPDVYDRDAVVAAWRSGDSSKLAAKNKAVLEACKAAIDETVDADMSEYEKELAIHDWMVAWGMYDMEYLNVSPNASPLPDNDNPYGFLIGGKGICVGYSSTFQLFMDLLDIECVTVFGRSGNNTEDHAWNMVKLDGEWYCVDVTWDDPSIYGTASAATEHKYFNVTSAFMRTTGHWWEEGTVEEATATRYRWNAGSSRG